jgi:hypothetical protein
MTTLSTINIATQKTTIEAEYKTLINGINTELIGVDPFVINGTTYTRADLLARLQSRITASEATKTARTALHNAVNSEQDLQAQMVLLRAGMKAYLISRFGKGSGKLQLFGFAQTKTTQKTAQSKAAAVVKSKATRTARGTLGKKQKSGIKGVVPVPATPSSPGPAAPSLPEPTTKPVAPAAVTPGAPHA